MNSYSTSLFFVACESNSLEVVEDAIKQGVQVNTIKSKTSALSIACQHHHIEIIHYLVQHKADVSLCDYQAIGKSNQESLGALLISGAITPSLVQKFKKSQQQRYQQFSLKIQKSVDYLLKEFCQKGDVNSAKKMIELSANVNDFDLVKVAMIGKHIDILILLLNHGININLLVENKTSFLIEACTQERTELVQLALNYGATISEGAIFTTMFCGENESFKLLLNQLPEVLSLKDKLYEAFNYYQKTTVHDYSEMLHFFNQRILKEELDDNLMTHPQINKMKL